MQSEENRGGLQGKFEGFGAAPSDGLWESIAQNGSLSEKFQDFGAVPTEGLWSSILANLEKRRRRKVFYLWMSGAAAMFLLTFGTYQFLNSVNPDNSEEQIVSIVEEEAFESNETENPLHEKQYSNDSELLENNTGSLEYTVEDERSDSKVNLLETANDSDPMQNQNAEKSLVGKTPIETEQLVAVKEEEIEKIQTSTIEKLDLLMEIPQPEIAEIKITPIEKFEKSWELAANYSFWGPRFGGVSQASYSLPGPVGPASVTVENDFETIEGTSGSVESAMFDLNPSSPVSEYESAVYGEAIKPINVELIAQRNVNRRFSWFTGLNYSRQNFKTSYASSVLDRTNSVLNTVGVPLGIRINFVEKDKWDLYVKAGNQLDIPLLERRSEEYTSTAMTNLDLEEDKTSRNSAFGFLSAVQTQVGYSRALTNRLNLNADLGVRYYYLQRVKNTAPLIKKDLWVGGSIGLSWEI